VCLKIPLRHTLVCEPCVCLKGYRKTLLVHETLSFFGIT
jgi:hypothetical protein